MATIEVRGLDVLVVHGDPDDFLVLYRGSSPQDATFMAGVVRDNLDRYAAGARLTFEELQHDVAALWRASAYGPAFLGRGDPQRDAHHAALHVTKAAGKLAGLLDDLDHALDVTPAADARHDEAGRYLADLVICAARIASKWPGGAVDLATAITARMAAKFPPKREG